MLGLLLGLLGLLAIVAYFVGWFIAFGGQSLPVFLFMVVLTALLWDWVLG